MSNLFFSILPLSFPMSVCLYVCLTLEEFVCREQRRFHTGQLSHPSDVASVLHFIALSRKVPVQVVRGCLLSKWTVYPVKLSQDPFPFD